LSLQVEVDNIYSIINKTSNMYHVVLLTKHMIRAAIPP